MHCMYALTRIIFLIFVVCSTSFQPSFQVLVAITYLLLAGVGENDKSSHGHYHFAELLIIANSNLKVT